MKLSIKAISDFKIIYKNRFGVDLNDEEANQRGLELLELFRNIYKQVPVEEAQKLQLFDTDLRAL